MEHRWGQRVSVDLPVHLDSAGLDSAGLGGVGKLRDISISGGFIETALAMPAYTNLGVVFLVGSGAAQRAVDLPACVTRVARDGFAVEWRDMACPTLLALLREAGAQFAHMTARDRAFS